jgi:uncharacterized membrane protein (DUF2068 family)
VLVILEALLGALLFMGAIGVHFRITHHVRYNPELDFYILLALAVTDAILAYGLWTRKSWAWIGGIAVAALSIILSVLTLFLRPTLGEVAFLFLNLMIMYLLMQPRIQGCFGHSLADQE